MADNKSFAMFVIFVCMISLVVVEGETTNSSLFNASNTDPLNLSANETDGLLSVNVAGEETTNSSLFNTSNADSLDLMRKIASQVRLQHEARVNSSAVSANETSGLLSVKVAGVQSGLTCNYYSSDFRFSASHDGWDQLQGRYSVGPTGFRINNDDYGGSRIRKAGWYFGPYITEESNYIKVVFRGAPDSGKNSYVCLREPRCQDDLKDSNCDEIDIVESYGSDQRAEAKSYRWTPGGQSRGTLYTLASSGTGSGFHTYELWQTPNDGHFSVAMDGSRRDFTDGPRDHYMMLYIGIWDCSQFCGPHVDHDSYMEIESVYMHQCF